jgi:uncharacterized protein YdhG (YjbR/CyaY superfamily)
MAAKTTTKARRSEATDVWTEEELAVMQEHKSDMKRASGGKVDGRTELLDKIAAMPPKDRALAERIDAIVTAAASELTSRTWYGMPAYYKDGKVLCFFQPAAKFKARYASLGFDDIANLDDGTMWPTSWALTPELTEADEARITDLVKRAVS